MARARPPPRAALFHQITLERKSALHSRTAQARAAQLAAKRQRKARSYRRRREGNAHSWAHLPCAFIRPRVNQHRQVKNKPNAPERGWINCTNLISAGADSVQSLRRDPKSCARTASQGIPPAAAIGHALLRCHRLRSAPGWAFSSFCCCFFPPPPFIPSSLFCCPFSLSGETPSRGAPSHAQRLTSFSTFLHPAVPSQGSGGASRVLSPALSPVPRWGRALCRPGGRGPWLSGWHSSAPRTPVRAGTAPRPPRCLPPCNPSASRRKRGWADSGQLIRPWEGGCVCHRLLYWWGLRARPSVALLPNEGGGWVLRLRSAQQPDSFCWEKERSWSKWE